ncbi:hypothetical protein [Methanosarcina sp.]|nr:hypothetical protein [Methanosarcina sp.]MDY9926389.1 hypothetical protein [Methanosarcina sp.]
MLPEKNKRYGEKKKVWEEKGRRGICESGWAEKKAGRLFLKKLGKI